MEQEKQIPSQNEVVKKQTKKYPFWLGGVAASIAVCFTHPLDLAKVRLQNSPAKISTAKLLRNTFVNEGVRGLYIGISASILRQMTYSLTRFAAYEELKTIVSQHTDPSQPTSIWTKISVASLAGAAGGVAGNPADVILVRLSLIHISEPTRREWLSRMPSSA